MKLNTLSPNFGSKKAAKRRGRGIGSGLGKTSGRGHKGQLARAGSRKDASFQGGQMPIQRRLPKFGFTSAIAAVTDEVRLHELARVKDGVITMASLQEASLISKAIKHVKIIKSGHLSSPITVSAEIRVTKGAREMIEAAGGTVGKS